MTLLRFEDYGKRSEFRTDVLVIGTGAGGAVVGAELAEAGVEVTFVEEGSYNPTSSFSPYAAESVPRLYRDGGASMILGRAPIPFVEGRTVGGTTVINGGMTWRAPDDVLDEWERTCGAELGGASLDPHFAKVEERVHAKHQHKTSVGNDNRVMAQGAKRMGWEVKVNRRNQESCVGANNCVFGCPTGAKQSTLVSYMPVAMQNGARCLTEVRITKLLIERGRCVGAVGRAIDPVTRRGGKRVTVRANSVVVACGAIQTPLLLERHRLGRPSRQLGKNFLCHPNVKVLAIYPGEVNAWQGVSQWCQIREFHDEGIYFAENFIAPTAVAAKMPYDGAEAWDLMSKYNHMVMSGVLVEDSTTGTVNRGPFGTPIIRYDITDYDHERCLKGTKLLAEMHFEMGAERVLLPFSNMHEARCVDDLAKIDAKVQRAETLELFTVHLMGTARMGNTAESSVVDLDGQLWDLPGCYVADASLFPTAIGVNPQITIMTLATRIAHRMLDARADRIAA